jgi:hypothetical protein
MKQRGGQEQNDNTNGDLGEIDPNYRHRVKNLGVCSLQDYL